MKKNAFFLTLLFYSFTAFTQTIEPKKRTSDLPSQAQVGFNLLLMSPQGQFGRQLGNLGGGFEMDALFRVKQGGIFALGANIGYVLYGNDREKRPWSSTVPDMEMVVERSNNLAFLHGIFRMEPDKGIIRPYLQGEFGIKYMFTRTSIQGTGLLNTAGNGNAAASSLNLGGANLSAGVGTGVNIVLNQKPNQLMLNLGGRYLFGGPMQYLTQNDVRIENSQVFYNKRWSTTDMLLLSIGATIKF